MSNIDKSLAVCECSIQLCLFRDYDLVLIVRRLRGRSQQPTIAAIGRTHSLLYQR